VNSIQPSPGTLAEVSHGFGAGVGGVVGVEMEKSELKLMLIGLKIGMLTETSCSLLPSAWTV
jgi:hypothetical protein